METRIIIPEEWEVEGIDLLEESFDCTRLEVGDHIEFSIELTPLGKLLEQHRSGTHPPYPEIYDVIVSKVEYSLRYHVGNKPTMMQWVYVKRGR